MPYKRFESIVTPTMWRNIVCQSIYQIIVLIIILFKGHEIFNVPNGNKVKNWTYENGTHYTIFLMFLFSFKFLMKLMLEN